VRKAERSINAMSKVSERENPVTGKTRDGKAPFKAKPETAEGPLVERSKRGLV
jgi:hypothetical protein